MSNSQSKFSDYTRSLEPSARRRALPSTEWPGLLADFSHNNYLGLAQDPELIAAAHACAQAYGVGATGARLLSGNLPPHAALDAAIAAAKGTECALTFNSGYQANATALAALLDKKVLGAEPLVFADRLNHASLHHGCQLAGVHQLRYRHNDLTHLRELLEKYAHDPRPKFLVAETVFGMDGDCLDMPAIAALADEFNLFLFLDEAHATGVLGTQGYGLAAQWMDGGRRGAVMGTFSKAIGVSGAYVACSEVVRDYLLNRCTGFIYSTGLSPAVVGAVQAAWAKLPSLQATRTALLETAAQFRHAVQALGFDTGTSTTHIVPLIVGAESQALALKDYLLERGLLASAIRPPTVPPHTARIRVSLSALHTPSQIKALCDALASWSSRL
ncbi:aminotransferase class I/II-fold pyridoxal phosphate-dependent enzyme [Parvibium lacunae]|uniref:8-amino-7-oxononanoate synthase n=1 Tax=Parvibium lacunae TaxID=1888893 RepID=A0A368L4P8_9BURK|nr:8-amino-7-oxononanoate synthase [Parvibium lacunae]RCS58130.1 8-amino-7-oxononanoate synthase [Parvibium lacunae]